MSAAYESVTSPKSFTVERTGTRARHKQSAWQVAAAVVVAEAVMVAVAIASGKLADKWGRKRLFLFGFTVLALRNGVTVLSHNEYYLISLQALDGVAMGIYGVLLTLITADLAKGAGRFNMLQGAVQSAMGLGGILSDILFGWVAKALGFNASFLGLAGIAVAGAALWQLKMPETKPAEGEERSADRGKALLNQPECRVGATEVTIPLPPEKPFTRL